MPAACRVLLVDKKQTLLKWLVAALQNRGLAVGVAQTDQPHMLGSAAADADVIVVTGAGEGGDCVSMLRKIRERYPDLPIILIDRRCQVDVALQAIRLGWVDYLTRPISPQKLCDKIEDAVERRVCFRELARITAAQREGQ